MKKYFLTGSIFLALAAFIAIGIPKTNNEDYELFGYVKDDISISIPARLVADAKGNIASYNEKQNIYTSEVKHTSFPFSGLGMSWSERTPKNSSVDMEVRFFTNDKWTNWEDIKVDEDMHENDYVELKEDSFNTLSSFITTNPSTAFQYRYTLNLGDNASPEIKDVHFTYINANDDPLRGDTSVLSSLMYDPGSLIASAHFSQSGIRYIARLQWGANEDLRVYKNDNPEAQLVSLPSDFYIRFAQELKLHKVIDTNKEGEKLTWPLQYPEKISKIIIHHTASTKDLDNPEKAIRDIYYYHAIARGWGDIGYNYIIDTKGNIYEGRYGGEGVVGAHAGPGNRGSIGIALLGNFNEEEVTPEALRALETLIADKTKLHNIDPQGESYFRGKKMPNIFGHNEIMATACPGTNLKNLMPQIRRDVAAMNGAIKYQDTTKSGNSEYAFEYIPSLEEIVMLPDRKMEYTIKIKNVGSKTWTKDTRLALESDALIDKGFSISISGMQESTVTPGQTGTFNVKLYSKLYDGFYYLSFKPIINGSEENVGSINIPTIVEKPYFAYELINISVPTLKMETESQTIGVVTLKNTGNVKWRNYGENRISLGTENPRDRISSFTKSTRMGYLKESIVNPGEVGHFIFNLKAPKFEGKYEEFFAPVIERVTWLDGNDMKIELEVS